MISVGVEDWNHLVGHCSPGTENERGEYFPGNIFNLVHKEEEEEEEEETECTISLHYNFIYAA